MYLDYFKLKEMPFKITPDPRFLHLTEQHMDALGKCLLTIKERGGMVAVYGEVGMGKTTLARRLLEVAADENFKAAMLITPALKTENAFLRAIMEEFDIAPGRSYAASLTAFHDFMATSYTNGTNLVLIIDEAQRLTPRLMGVLHSLLNFESNIDKYLQIVLIGQSELATNIDKQPNIKSRVTRFARLSSLNPDESSEMIAFRWHAASSGKSSHPFTDEALQAIYLASGGLPREINKLCHESLSFAFNDGINRVTPNLVVEAAKELRLGPGGQE